MTSQPGLRTNAIHVLAKISRSKGNKIMKFGQLLEYNLTNIFVEKSYTKCGGEGTLWRRNFFSNLWINSLRFIRFVYIVC